LNIVDDFTKECLAIEVDASPRLCWIAAVSVESFVSRRPVVSSTRTGGSSIFGAVRGIGI
jgi:hypothetical protein